MYGEKSFLLFLKCLSKEVLMVCLNTGETSILLTVMVFFCE